MAIKEYSLAKDGAKQLSPAFRVREFRCRDGSDAIMIDQTLVVLLQAIREHFGKAVTITSGLPHRNLQHRRRRLQIQPAPAGQGGGHPGGGHHRGGRGRIRREPDAGLGRRGPLPGEERTRQGLGACGHPRQKEQMDAVRG